MILSTKINNSAGADLELNFTTNTWSLPPATAKWGGVMFSDRGLFEVRPNGTIWLLDGVGSAKKSCTVILHDAPAGEEDGAHSSGTGRAIAPATAKHKDGQIQWRV